MNRRDGTIRFHLDVGARGKGTAYRVSPNGKKTPVGNQRYSRVTRALVYEGATLYNPVTRETHRVLGVEPLVIQTTAGPKEVSWEDCHASLVVVI